MIFRLAHFSDIHLGPVTAGDIVSDFAVKRLIGGSSWHFRRKFLHRKAIADALKSDVLRQAPDHIAFTGDLVNICSQGEFARGEAWLRDFGDADRLSFVPGNHDAYVCNPYPTGLGRFARYFTGAAGPDEAAFPFVRLRRNIAIIGVSSAVPQSLWRAGGTLGTTQIASLAEKLADLARRGFYRVLMIHHPPLPGLAVNRKALTDAAALQDVLVARGVELVLHGHNHLSMINKLQTATGTAHIIGVPSGSMASAKGHETAQWNIYGISRNKGQWETLLTIRAWNDARAGFHDLTSGVLETDR